jgi:hypothetical protein
MLLTQEVSHFEISGKEVTDVHPWNIALILITLEVSQFEKSGKERYALQP